ncbi:MAG: peptidase M61 [Bacteroidota bacterium]
MLKKLLIINLFFLFSVNVFAQNINQNDRYQYQVDLNNVEDDKLTVTLISPKINQSEIVFNIPKTVPGTYSNDDYGRYVSDFKAFDKKGKKLKVTKQTINTYKIAKATKLFKITYKVDDSWDSPEIAGGHIFEPTGSNIDKDKCFAINNHAFFGYFTDMKGVSFDINFKKPSGFYGATSMEAVKSDNTEDLFTMPNYQTLVDAPILYSKPDTTILNIGGAKILVSVVSPEKKASSKEIAENLRTMLEAQKDYLGGSFPVNKYAFLIVLADVLPGNSYGALEHSYSSFYYLPEATSDELSQTVKDVASHEFFHIVTPLSIHAEQIGDFDYNNPKMSKHLWMYEGLTEYAAGHMQIKHGLIEMPLYFSMLREKIQFMKSQKDDLPFTEMSANVLDKYKDQYQNVYNKGALIGLCLDIKLRQLSDGKYGTQNLMKDLAKTYGKNVSFKDEELFDKITQLTYPEIREFFRRYVEGPEALPLTDVLGLVGISFSESEKMRSVNLGNVALSFNPDTKRLFVANISNISDFGKKVGYSIGDEFISLNGKALNMESFQTVMKEFKEKAKEGDPFSVVVMRKNDKGEFTEKELSAVLEGSESTFKNVLKLMDNPTEAQLKLREAWLDPARN